MSVIQGYDSDAENNMPLVKLVKLAKLVGKGQKRKAEGDVAPSDAAVVSAAKRAKVAPSTVPAPAPPTTANKNQPPQNQPQEPAQKVAPANLNEQIAGIVQRCPDLTLLTKRLVRQQLCQLRGRSKQKCTTISHTLAFP
jgi:hypothetical protein